MKKKFKLFATIATLCLTLAIFSFGVFSALTVTYKTTGTVTYEIADTYVELETRVYYSSKQFTGNGELATTSEALATSGFDTLNALPNLDAKYTFGKVQIKSTDTPSTFEENPEYYVDTYSSVTDANPPEDLSLALSYSTTDSIYSYFVVTKIVNKSALPLYAYVNYTGDDKYVAPENSYTYKISEYKQLAGLNSEVYIVFAMALTDITVAIDTAEFVYPITVTKDVPENVTFTANESIININSLTLNGATKAEYAGVDMNAANNLNLKDITVPANSSVSLSMSVNSKDTTNYQKLVLSYPNGIPAGLEVNSSSLILPKSADAKTFTITFTNTTTRPQNLDYVQFDLSVQPVETLLQKDETLGYQYVEMGTVATATGNEYIRWRYISTDGQTQVSTDQNTMAGYYVLETDIHSIILNKLLTMTNLEIKEYVNSGAPLGTMVMFNEEQEYGNDYEDSLVRKYLNATTETFAKFGGTSQSSNFVKDLNIDVDTDLVYTQIKARDLGYEDDDKFWLLSYEEVTNLLCGGTYNAAKADWDTNNNTAYYWLRTAYAELSNGACTIHSDGTYGYNFVDTEFIAARAGFIIG